MNKRSDEAARMRRSTIGKKRSMRRWRQEEMRHRWRGKGGSRKQGGGGGRGIEGCGGGEEGAESKDVEEEWKEVAQFK